MIPSENCTVGRTANRGGQKIELRQGNMQVWQAPFGKLLPFSLSFDDNFSSFGPHRNPLSRFIDCHVKSAVDLGKSVPKISTRFWRARSQWEDIRISFHMTHRFSTTKFERNALKITQGLLWVCSQGAERSWNSSKWRIFEKSGKNALKNFNRP